MVKCLLPVLLTAALVVFAAPRVLGDNGGYTQLSRVENPWLLALGEGVDDASDKQFAFSLRAAIESTLERFPVIDLFPTHGSVRQHQASGYDLEIYALNCKIII